MMNLFQIIPPESSHSLSRGTAENNPNIHLQKKGRGQKEEAAPLSKTPKNPSEDDLFSYELKRTYKDKHEVEGKKLNGGLNESSMSTLQSDVQNSGHPGNLPSISTALDTTTFSSAITEAKTQKTASSHILESSQSKPEMGQSSSSHTMAIHALSESSDSAAFPQLVSRMPDHGERQKGLNNPVENKPVHPMPQALQANSGGANPYLMAKSLQSGRPAVQSLQGHDSIIPSESPVNSTTLFSNDHSLESQKGFEQGQGRGFLSHSPLGLSTTLQESKAASDIQITGALFESFLETGMDFYDDQSILRQVEHHLRSWRPGQNESIRFLLEPKQLGILQIDILFQENEVTAHMVTGDPYVKGLLEGNRDFLETNLRSQGFQMQQFSVDLGRQQGFLNHQHPAPGFLKPEWADPNQTQTGPLDLPEKNTMIQEAGRLSLYI